MSPNNKKKSQDAPVQEPAQASKEEQEHSGDEGEEEGDVDIFEELDLPAPVLRRVKGLRKLHEEMETIEEEYKKQRIELEKSFLARKEALYATRSGVVKGETDCNEEGGKVDFTEGEEKGVPSFWLTALSSHPAIGHLITEEDVPAMEALTDITCAYDDEFKSFELSFHFGPNDFFTNEKLTKKYFVEPDLLDDKSPALMKIDGCEIAWKASKNLCVKEITKKQKAKSGRNKGQVRTITRSVPKPSFFHYFDEREENENEEEEQEQEEENEEGVGQIKFNLDEDYDIGHTIRTSIIPEAILFFTGEAEIDDGMMFGDEEDDEDEEGEEGEEDDEEGDEDEAAADDKKKTKKGAAAGAAAGDKPAECKQS